MTYRQTITPSNDPETAPQSCGDDPFGLDDIPDFLRRTPGSIPEDGAFQQDYTAATETLAKMHGEG